MSPDPSRKPKLLVDCTPLWQGGGVQVAIAFLLNLILVDRVEWIAVAPDRIRPLMPPVLRDDARLHWMRKAHALDRALIGLRMKGVERRFRPDVVFTVFGPAFFTPRARHVVGFALPNFIYARDIETAMQRWINRVADAVRRLLLRRADGIVVETSVAASRLVARLSIPADRVKVIGNTINPLLHQQPITDEADPGNLIFVPSAYYAHKNLEQVVDVARVMREIEPDTPFRFLMTLPADSVEWQAIAEKAQRQGVSAYVRTLGELDLASMARCYNAATLVYLPTLREISTAVYPESFYFGRPLVTSDLDFARELCGDAAHFVSPKDPEDAARAILKLIANPASRTAMVKKGRSRLDTYVSPNDKFVMQMQALGLEGTTHL